MVDICCRIVSMDKKEYIEGLEKIGWPKDQFIILSGGSLLMCGIREQTQDYDLAVSADFAKKIGLHDAPKNENGLYMPFEGAEISDTWFDEIEYDNVDGYQCESLESILAFKRKKMRPKDIVDIEKIEEFLKR